MFHLTLRLLHLVANKLRLNTLISTILEHSEICYNG
jgi:hypothetical protein